MCIMEVNRKQLSSTIAQACAHNTNTVKGDLEMFRELLAHRLPSGDPANDALLQEYHLAYDTVTAGYEQLLHLYGQMVAREAFDPEAHVHDHDHAHEGSERVVGDPVVAGLAHNQLVQIAEDIVRRDESRAHPYETR